MEVKRVGKHGILYVMAADPEYGPHLKKRFTPLMTGIGPVEAAVRLTLALAQLKAQKNLPDLIVSLGSAGSAILDQTGIYQVASVSYRDMDASPLGFEKGRTPLLDLPAKIDLTIQIPSIASASLATGASIVSGEHYTQIDADMVDMETFALLRAAMYFDRPFFGLRGISDGKNDLNHLDDWTQYLHIIDEKLSNAVDTLEATVKSGKLL